jgi:glycosyltransferase involved in cell wall biosynthesis
VLVGLSKEQISTLPANIIGIEHTNSVAELVNLYSAAYVFVNATYEDNYPTTNLEAIACGTPVITYDTGGSPESAEEFGIVLKNKSAGSIFDALSSVDSLTPKSFDFSKEKSISSYLQIFKELL